jgi:hypothetical protein
VKTKTVLFCNICKKTFSEIAGRKYLSGDIVQWCPNCGAGDDHIIEIDNKMENNSNKLTKEDFVNAGYSKADAARLANDSNFNWKAANGGKRKT